MNGRLRAIVLIALLVGTGVAGLQAQPRREALQAPATKAVPEGRIDPATGRWQARYRVRTPVAWQGSAEATARAYLRREAAHFGWQQPDRTLAVDRVRTTPYAMHVRFRQTLAGLPVYGRYVQVNLNRRGRPTLVLSGYEPRLEAYATRFDPTPRLSATEALAEARRRLAQPEAPTTTPELVVWPSEPPRLAWHFVLWPQDRPDEWVVLIDTHTGALLHVRSQAVQERPAKATRAKATAAWTSTAPLPVGLVTGEGMVFDPDPLATAGVAYGGAYADNDDADTPELNAERLVVTLPDITQGGDGLYRLEGPYVRITGDIPGYPSLYDPPAEATPDAFQYTRSNDHFEAVMAYYHIDRSQRYVQQLDLGTPLQAAPIRVNPHGLEDQDNSMYLPGANAIVFGDGGVDDAEDATVIWHEYMHALLEDAAPGLLGNDVDEREGVRSTKAGPTTGQLPTCAGWSRPVWCVVRTGTSSFAGTAATGRSGKGDASPSPVVTRKTRTATAKTRPAVPATSTRTGCSGRPCSWRFRTCSAGPSPIGWRWRPRCI